MELGTNPSQTQRPQKFDSNGCDDFIVREILPGLALDNLAGRGDDD
jgi:hypothetical protein